MTLEQYEKLIARQKEIAEEREGIIDTADERLGNPETDLTQYRGVFILDDEGNPTEERDANVGLSEEEITRMGELDADAALVTTQIERYKPLVDATQAGNGAPTPGGAGPTILQRNTPHDYERARGLTGENLRAQALTALEHFDATVAEGIEATMRSIAGNGKNGKRQANDAYRYVIAHSSEEYRQAFAAVLAGHAQMGLLSEDQRQAMTWAMEARATLDIDSGLSFPVNVDPSFLRTGAMSVSPLRSLASVRSGTARTHYVNTFGAATLSKANDGDEVAADTTPGTGSAQIDAELVQGVMSYTISSAEDDVSALESELANAAAEAATNLEASDMTNGDGVAPNAEGVLDGATVTRIAGLTATKYTEEDVISVVNAVPQRYRGKLRFMGASETHNAARFFEDGGGTRTGTAATITQEGQKQLVGRDFAENSEMAGPTTGVDTFTTGDDLLVGGDFEAGYRIYDRVGMSVEFIPHMLGTANNLPNGSRGLYIRMRYGAGITVPDALRVLEVS